MITVHGDTVEDLSSLLRICLVRLNLGPILIAGLLNEGFISFRHLSFLQGPLRYAHNNPRRRISPKGR